MPKQPQKLAAPKPNASSPPPLDELLAQADALGPPGPGGGRPISAATKARLIELHKARPGLTVTQLGKLCGVATGSAANILRNVRAEAVAASSEPEPTDDAGEDETNVTRLERLARRLIADADSLRAAGDVRGAAAVQDRCVRVLERVHELAPPPEADPMQDPNNIAAREDVVARVEGLIARAEVGRQALEQIARGVQ